MFSFASAMQKFNGNGNISHRLPLPHEWLKVLLCFIVLYNLAILTTAIVSTATVNNYNKANYFWKQQWDVNITTNIKIRQAFYFNTIPIALCVISGILLLHGWRHPPRPMHTIISSSASLSLCALASAIWTACTYTHPGTHWCPIPKQEWTEAHMRNAYFALPWLLILNYFLYISLLLAGILAYRREYLAYYAQQQDVLSLKTADLTIVPSISELAPSTIYQPPLARSSSKWSFAPSEATELPGYEETGPSRAGSRRHFTSRHSSAHFCSHCGQIDE